MVQTGKKRGSTGNTRIDAGQNTEKTKNVRITYTNIDGLISSILEVRDYLREEKPDVMCMTETKLRQEILLNFEKEGYKLWRRDRKGKGGGGVLILVREDIQVEDVQYGSDMAEVISITIRIGGGERRKIIVAYVPPKTNAWKEEEH